MDNRFPLLPSPQLLSPPMLPGSKFDYFHRRWDDPKKGAQWAVGMKRTPRELCYEGSPEKTRDAYLTPDPSSQLGFCSSPTVTRRPLSSIPILRPKTTGEPITIGRSSVRCSHPIPQQWLNLYISRVHAVIVYKSSTRQISVQCRGVNPITINTPYETHRLENRREMLFHETEDIKLNIAGYVVIVEGPDSSEEVPTLSPPLCSQRYPEPEKRLSTFTLASSPPRMSSLTPTPEQSRELELPLPQGQDIKIYQDEVSSPPESSLSPAPEELSPSAPGPSPLVSTQVGPADPSLLDALLTTLIFAELKPTSLPRLLADLSNRFPNAKQEQVLTILMTVPCIGIVHRSGKDAAGKPLPDEYYYIPEMDDNEARRARYYQFARPTRSCRLKHSQYHWRPVKLRGNRSRPVHSSPGIPAMQSKRKRAKKVHQPPNSAGEGKENEMSTHGHTREHAVVS